MNNNKVFIKTLLYNSVQTTGKVEVLLYNTSLLYNYYLRATISITTETLISTNNQVIPC